MTNMVNSNTPKRVVGNRIKQCRLAAGLTVDQVAKKLNKNRTTVYRYENNNIQDLPISVLEPLARILHTTPAFLLGWDDDKLPQAPKRDIATDLDSIVHELSNAQYGTPEEQEDAEAVKATLKAALLQLRRLNKKKYRPLTPREKELRSQWLQLTGSGKQEDKTGETPVDTTGGKQ